LLVILGFTVATSVLTALQPLPLKLLVDYAIGNTTLSAPIQTLLETRSLSLSPTVFVIVAAASSLGLYALNASADAGLSLTWATAGQRMVYDLAEDMFHRLQRLSLLFHNQRTVGDSLSRLTGDTYCPYILTDALLVSPVRHLLTLASISLIAWRLEPMLTVLSIAVVPILASSAMIFGAQLKRRMQRYRETQSRLFSFVHQTLTAIPIVQAFGTEVLNRQQFQHLAADTVMALQHNAVLNSVYGIVNGSVAVFSTTAVLYIGGGQVMSGSMTVGSLLVFLAYLRSIQAALGGLLSNYGSLKALEANIDRVLEILDSEERVRDAPGAKPLTTMTQPRGHVCFEQATFGYDPNRPVLNDISLHANPGETIAIVGPTGAGKSTLVSLIPRFFDPWQGRILFDGIDVRQIQLKSLRSQITLVLQEPFLLPLTIAENIAYGHPHASDEEIVAAAKAARADEFIQRLPQGYSTVVGERGATLSGGEKQRLAIARALLKDAPVLILDEPTSALDAHTEALLLEALERLMAGRTTFVIAHRLSTIRQADRIVVLEHGRIVEVGTHQQLLAARGSYHHLHTLQTLKSSWEAVL
jgi:ATP-binding cassette subfamily B protein/subfamily B ATP-binding cassette protein MsbA